MSQSGVYIAVKIQGNVTDPFSCTWYKNILQYLSTHLNILSILSYIRSGVSNSTPRSYAKVISLVSKPFICFILLLQVYAGLKIGFIIF